MLGVIRPLAARLVNRRHNPELSLDLLGLIVAAILLSAAATDKIGVHPLFGASLAGVCFPRIQHWQTAIREPLDMLVSVLLLPLFFALTGMRTRLDLLDGASIWLWPASSSPPPSSARWEAPPSPPASPANPGATPSRSAPC